MLRVDNCAILLSFLGHLSVLGMVRPLRVLRVLRVARILKLGRYSTGLQMFGRTLKATQFQVDYFMKVTEEEVDGKHRLRRTETKNSFTMQSSTTGSIRKQKQEVVEGEKNRHLESNEQQTPVYKNNNINDRGIVCAESSKFPRCLKMLRSLNALGNSVSLEQSKEICYTNKKRECAS
ncbi:unnamed protein product [Onchocerca ochengi]|uniref:Pentatricopeptide repeat-containing protein n=1 Tax=Onchocerca ochengi TaxID=42157 RepID=A0A182DWR7_ONCOC|nr:unnamed protein product [Onchocerca ochengi]